MKIKFKEVYCVNEKKGEVICKLRIQNINELYYLNYAIRDIQRNTSNKYDNEAVPKNIVIPQEFIGYAHLADGDTWLTATGRKVARDKAYEKYAIFKQKFENYIKNTAMEISAEFKLEKKSDKHKK